MRYPLLILATMLAGCMKSSEPGPLRFEESFSMGDNDYLVFVFSNPEEPRAGQPFTLEIRLLKAEGHGAVKHLTYEVQILDEGRNVFVDSRHAMEGAPYVRDLTLGAGDYTLKLVISHGMGEETMKLYETELKFRVKVVYVGEGEGRLSLDVTPETPRSSSYEEVIKEIGLRKYHVRRGA